MYKETIKSIYKIGFYNIPFNILLVAYCTYEGIPRINLSNMLLIGNLIYLSVSALLFLITWIVVEFME